MSTDDYQRVSRLPFGSFGSDHDEYLQDDNTGRMKVVPADAIVIEPEELAVVDTALGATDGTLIAVVTVDDQHTEHLYWTPGQRDPRLMARLYLSIAEHLDARPSVPPVDEAQVEALAAEIHAVHPSPRLGDEIARHLVAQGWTNPEVKS